MPIASPDAVSFETSPSAVICGSGLDGLALALVLGRAGWRVRLLRDEPRRTARAYLLHLEPALLPELDALGILPALGDAVEQVSNARWVDARGRPIAGLPAEATSSERLHILCENLDRILLTHLPPNVKVVPSGLSVSRAQVHPECVELHLSSGERLRVDLLFGADGAHSRVRELVFGSDGVWKRALGHHSAAFVFEDRSVHRTLDQHLTVLSAPGRLLALCPLRQHRVAATFAFRAERDFNPKSPADWLKFVFGDVGWVVPTVLRHAERATDLRYDRASEIKTGTWQRSRAALLGDACHTCSVLPGQGCAWGIAAAARLGGDLVRGIAFEAAFAQYEASLAHEIQRRREALSGWASWLMPESRVDWTVRNSLLRMSRVPGLRRLMPPGNADRRRINLLGL